MQEEQTTTAAEAMPTSTTEQPLKAWITPAFERVPLNEAMGGSTTSSSDVAFSLS